MAGFGRGMDGGKPALTGDDEMIVNEVFRGDLFEVPGDGGGVEDRIAAAGCLEEGLRCEVCDR